MIQHFKSREVRDPLTGTHRPVKSPQEERLSTAPESMWTFYGKRVMNIRDPVGLGNYAPAAAIARTARTSPRTNSTGAAASAPLTDAPSSPPVAVEQAPALGAGSRGVALRTSTSGELGRSDLAQGSQMGESLISSSSSRASDDSCESHGGRDEPCPPATSTGPGEPSPSQVKDMETVRLVAAVAQGSAFGSGGSSSGTAGVDPAALAAGARAPTADSPGTAASAPLSDKPPSYPGKVEEASAPGAGHRSVALRASTDGNLGKWELARRKAPAPQPATPPAPLAVPTTPEHAPARTALPIHFVLDYIQTVYNIGVKAGVIAG